MKTNKTIKIIALALAVILSISACIASLSFFDKIIESNSDSENENLISGGQLISKQHFDSFSIDPVSGYQRIDDMYINTYNYNATVTQSYNGVKLDYSCKDSNFYVRFLTASDYSDIKVSKYDYFTVDFDISLSNISCIRMFLVFRGFDNSAYGSSYSWPELYKNGDEFYFRCTSSSGSNVLKRLSAEKTHFTFIYDFKSEPFPKVNIYIDGHFVLSISNIVACASSNIDYVEAFCLQSTSYADEEGSFCVQDVTFYGFDTGYTGAICDIFKNPERNLKNNPDSILYKG